eukprot:scaffold170273_cov37-Tisochrysis_lutea.AAC.2
MRSQCRSKTPRLRWLPSAWRCDQSPPLRRGSLEHPQVVQRNHLAPFFCACRTAKNKEGPSSRRGRSGMRMPGARVTVARDVFRSTINHGPGIG